MLEKTAGFSAGVVDFNPNRMSKAEAEAHDIPLELSGHVADWRQYPLRIGRQLEGIASWYDPETLWYYRALFSNDEMVMKLMSNDVLILSGSGMSAYNYQEDSHRYKPEDLNAFQRAQETIKDFLGVGKWVLGICFGGQLAVHAVGGRLGRLPNNMYGNAITEAGWLAHQLTDAGKTDEVFGYLSDHDPVWAPHLHNDYVQLLPEVGSVVRTNSGEIEVVESKVLMVRKGYSDRYDVRDKDHEYIHAARVVFDNGSRLYQIQPHPEMATPDEINFLVRRNIEWLKKEEEMGPEFTIKALSRPYEPDYAIGELLGQFTSSAKDHEERRRQVTFADAVLAKNILGYLIN